MKRGFIIAAVMAIASPALAQSLPPETFSAFVNGLPTATGLGTADQLYLRQGGASRQITGITINGGVAFSNSPSTGYVPIASSSATAAWGQLACSNLSNGATGCSTATGTSGATIPLLNGANTWSALQTFNGGISGALNGVNVTGTPASGYVPVATSSSTAVWTIDNNPLRNYCYIGDGSAHALSTVNSCKGINTSGYTLTQWQVLLPTAASLSDDIDGDAINSYIAAQGSNPVVISLPGRAVINTPITSCAGSLYISGVGQGVSITVETSSIAAFKHCQSASPPTSSSFQLKNLLIICSGVACGDAMDVTLNNSTEPGFLLDTVSVTTLAGGQWANGAMTVGSGGSRVTNSVIALASGGTISGTCLSVVSAVPFTVLFQVVNTHLYWCAQAEQVTSAGENNGVEGVYNVGVNADQVLNFFNYTTIATCIAPTSCVPPYNPPEMVFMQTQVSFYRTLFSVNAAAGTAVTDWVIRDGYHIQLPPNGNSGSVTPATGVIDLGNAQRVTIDTNTFLQSAGATWNYLINSCGQGWQIEHNYSPVLLGTISGGIIQICSGQTEFIERDNDWAYPGTRITNNAYAAVSVASEAYIWDQSSGACQLLGMNRRGTISGRSIQCTGNVTNTLTSGAVNFTLPASIFQGSVAPTVITGNCRNGTTIYPSDTNGSPVFSANQWFFNILCSGGANNIINFQWTATGG